MSEIVKAQPKHQLVAVYYRVSSQGQTDRDTIERQRYVCAGIVEKMRASGATIVGEFLDHGYNLEAYDPSRSLWRILEQVEKGLVTTLVIASDCRISRGESQSLRGRILDTLRAGGVRVVTPTSDQLFLRSDTTSRLVTTLSHEVGSVNKINLVTQLQTAYRMGIQQRNFHQPIAPYAIRVDRSIINRRKHFTYRAVESEAEIVRDVFSLYLGRPTRRLRSHASKPLGYAAIAKILTDNEVDRKQWIAEAAKSASPAWTPSSVVKLLSCNLYCGKRTIKFRETDLLPSKEIKQEAIGVSIINIETFDEVQRLRAKKAEALDRSDAPMVVSADLWFHSFLRCAVCSGRLTLRNNYRRRVSYYSCQGSHVMPRLELLHELIKEAVGHLWLSDELRSRIRQAVVTQMPTLLKNGQAAKNAPRDKTSVEVERRAVERQLGALTERYAVDEVSDDDYQTLAANLNTKLLELAAAVAPPRSKKQKSSVDLLRPDRYIDQVVADSENNGAILRVIFEKLEMLIRVTHTRPRDPLAYELELVTPGQAGAEFRAGCSKTSDQKYLARSRQPFVTQQGI